MHTIHHAVLSMCRMLECLLGNSPPSNTAWQPQLRVHWKLSLLSQTWLSFHLVQLLWDKFSLLLFTHNCFIFKRLWFLFYCKLTQLQSVYVDSNLPYMVSLFYRLSVCLSVCLYVCLSVCLSVCMFVDPPNGLAIETKSCFCGIFRLQTIAKTSKLNVSLIIIIPGSLFHFICRITLC